MSNIYIQEPPTSGKVLLTTSFGEIEIELWSREAPLACRNFVQLCLEGYYDGTIFHRIVKGFIAQGGDPTGKGYGGESVYGKPFRDEIHSRLRFIRRGLVAMANGGKDDNTSQFFFTFAGAPELQNKHTIFGKVVGQTVFNMLKLEDIEVDSEDRPLFPPKIIKTEVLKNPFTDVVPREVSKNLSSKENEKCEPTVTGTKNFSLLSFGGEAEEDEEELIVMSKTVERKSKSIHDILNDEKLSSKSCLEDESQNHLNRVLENVRKKLNKKKGNDEESKSSSINKSKVPNFEPIDKESSKLDEEKHQNSVKRKNSDESKTEARNNYLEELNMYSSLNKKIPKLGATRESLTIALLEKFKQNIVKKSDTSVPKVEEKETEGNKWMSHTFKCFNAKQPTPLDKLNKFHEFNDDMYDISDPRNSMNKRRREDSKKANKSKHTAKSF